jgi:general secretion pathway protein L
MTADGGHQRSAVSLREWRWPITLAGMLLLVNIVALNADWWRLRSEGLQLRDEIANIYQRSFPNDKVVLDPLAQMKQKLALSRQASGQLSNSDYVVLSAALGEAWREAGNDLRAVTTLDYADGRLSIKLKQGVQISLEALRNPLANRQLQLTPSPADPLLFHVRHL